MYSILYTNHKGFGLCIAVSAFLTWSTGILMVFSVAGIYMILEGSQLTATQEKDPVPASALSESFSH